MDEQPGVVAEQGQEIPEASDAGDGPTEQAPADSSAPSGTTPTIDWEAEANPYKPFKRQYEGLQGNFKTQRQQLDQLLAERPQVVEALAVAQAKAEGRSDEEVESIKRTVQAEAAQVQQQTILRSILEQLAPVAKEKVLRDIAKEYGVDPTALDEASTADEAVGIAKALAKVTRKETIQQRQISGADKVEGGGGAPRSFKDIEAAFGEGRVDYATYAKARQAAGL